MIDEQKYRAALDTEKALLEKELSSLGAANEDGDTIVQKPRGDEFGPDRNVNSDVIEDMNENNAAARELTGRLTAVRNALKKIGEGGYGHCEVCGKEIEEDRLRANPAAPTCKEHMG
ncbi:MAG: TraR/DksA C4-type zinc finger protein [Patescibacteria group bacterium]|nr:TraR/DksA C4-type zinc finger protein [Patescibacteria group bacterium]